MLIMRYFLMSLFVSNLCTYCMLGRSKSNLVHSCLFISSIQGVALVVAWTVVRYCNKKLVNLCSSGKLSFVNIALLHKTFGYSIRRLKSWVKVVLNVSQSVRNTPEVAPLHPWLWPSKPWSRVHIDFAGPLRGHSYLILVDAHSKWPEVIDMNSATTSATTIRELRKIFARFGLPEQLVSDNGPQFVSAEFTQFLKSNGVKHIKSAPYHPSTNGIGEHFVQSFKRAMLTNESLPLEQRLASFLLQYRTTVHATTNAVPCMLLMNRQLRTRLDLL